LVVVMMMITIITIYVKKNKFLSLVLNFRDDFQIRLLTED
jgi:hypothetical protein